MQEVIMKAILYSVSVFATGLFDRVVHLARKIICHAPGKKISHLVK
jgi:hypothetical protein